MLHRYQPALIVFRLCPSPWTYVRGPTRAHHAFILSRQLDPRHSLLLSSPYTYNSLISKVEFDPSNVSELASIGGKGADSRICWWDVRSEPSSAFARAVVVQLDLNSSFRLLSFAAPTKPVSSIKPPFQPFQMSHHPTERVVAVSDIKEVITFYDQRMLPSTPSAAAKPLATTTGEAMEGVEEGGKTLGWAASEKYTYPDTQAFALKGAKVVVSLQHPIRPSHRP